MRTIIAICVVACVAAGCGGPQTAPVASVPQPQPMVQATGPALTETIEPDVAKYMELSEPELQAKVRECQVRESQGADLLANAREALAAATAAYDGATEADKPDALVKKIEAEAAVKASEENHSAAQKDLFAAQEAYKRVLGAQAQGN